MLHKNQYLAQTPPCPPSPLVGNHHWDPAVFPFPLFSQPPCHFYCSSSSISSDSHDSRPHFSTIASPNMDVFCRIFEPCEDSDWEVAFRESIRPGTTASPPAPSTTWRGEDTSENTEHHHQHGPQTSWTTNSLDHRDNPPIELNDNAQIFELDLPVIDAIPSGSVAPLWSHTFISNTSPKYPSIPLYIAEGREDPEKDEGIDEPSRPLASSPMISGPPQASPHIFEQTQASPNIFEPSQASPMIFEPSQASPMIFDQSQTSSPTFEQTHASPVADPQPEDFIDRCDILQWVIDDSNITPNVLIANPAAPATITSGSLQNVQPNATTANFIMPIKTDEFIEIPTVVASTSRTYALRPPSPLVKSEPEDSGSDWEPIHLPSSRCVDCPDDHGYYSDHDSNTLLKGRPHLYHQYDDHTTMSVGEFLLMTDFKSVFTAIFVYIGIFTTFLLANSCFH